MDGKFRIAVDALIWYVPYILNMEIAWKILRTRLKKEMVVLENLP